jgi:hypothetical protein
MIFASKPLSKHPARTWRALLGQVTGAVFLLTASTACDPVFRLGGTIKAPTGAAVAGATVRCLCDGAMQGGELRTQADGSFGEERIGWCSDSCVVRIEAKGFEPKELPVGQHCRARPSVGGTCITVQVDTTLTPANGSAASE